MKAISYKAKSRKYEAGVVSQACITCQKRRVKCDGAEPCSRCTTLNEECSYAPRKKRGPKPGQRQNLREEVERLQTKLDEAQHIIHPGSVVVLSVNQHGALSATDQGYVDAFMTFVNPSIPMVNVEAFNNALVNGEINASTSRGHASRVTLYGVLGIGAKMCFADEDAKKYMSAARECARNCFDEPSQEMLSGLLTMTYYHLGMGDIAKGALYIGLARQMSTLLPHCQDLRFATAFLYAVRTLLADATDDVSKLEVIQPRLQIEFAATCAARPGEMNDRMLVTSRVFDILCLVLTSIRLCPDDVRKQQSANFLELLDEAEELTEKINLGGSMQFSVTLIIQALKAGIHAKCGNVPAAVAAADRAAQLGNNRFRVYSSPFVSSALFHTAHMLRVAGHEQQFLTLREYLHDMSRVWKEFVSPRAAAINFLLTGPVPTLRPFENPTAAQDPFQLEVLSRIEPWRKAVNSVAGLIAASDTISGAATAIRGRQLLVLGSQPFQSATNTGDASFGVPLVVPATACANCGATGSCPCGPGATGRTPSSYVRGETSLEALLGAADTVDWAWEGTTAPAVLPSAESPVWHLTEGRTDFEVS